MSRINGKKITVHGVLVDNLLKDAGYSKLNNGSWILNWKEQYEDGYDYYRFHIYEIRPNVLEIHTDTIKKQKRKRPIHIAGRIGTSQEKQRIKKLLPVIESAKGGKRYPALSREERLKALEEMGDPIIKHLNWHERLVWKVKRFLRWIMV